MNISNIAKDLIQYHPELLEDNSSSSYEDNGGGISQVESRVHEPQVSKRISTIEKKKSAMGQVRVVEPREINSPKFQENENGKQT